MKRITVSLLCIFLAVTAIAQTSKNCSTFMFKTGNGIFVGHNLDESPELHIPGLVCVNKRGTYREGMTWSELISNPVDYEKAVIPFEEKSEPKLAWVSKYGSISFNSEGVDFPDGGINEEGLSIFEMSLGNTEHKYDKTNPTLFMVLWIQYVLDNFSSLDEVIASTDNINLQGWSWHYFVTDKNGNSAVIEFLGGKAVVHQGTELVYPVLCNTQYSVDLNRVEEYRDFDGLWYRVRSFFKNPPRFVRAVKLMEEYDPSVDASPKDYGLKILDEIKIDGWNKWGILIDVKEMVIYFHTDRNRKLRYISMKDFDFSADMPAKILDIHADLSGAVSNKFTDYSYEANLKHTNERAEYLFAERFKGLIDNGVTSEIYAKRFADYSERIREEK